jgi:methionine-S-sulfoxide reductase
MKKTVFLSFIYILISVLGNEVLAINKKMSPSATSVKTAEPFIASKAYFAGGCFWCMESPFEKQNGVSSVISGFMGGHVVNPSYEQVSTGTTGHIETVEVNYNPQIISYEKLLEIFWRQIDPTDPNGQFVDQGESYKSMIFYNNENEKKSAEESKKKLGDSKKFDKPIVTDILPAKPFYPAEEYHQDYYKKNPIRYKYYRSRSGRDDFLNKYWK